MKICSTSLSIREMQSKPTMKYHYIPIIIAKIKIMTASNGDKCVEKLDDSYVAGGSIKWYSHSGKFDGFC